MNVVTFIQWLRHKLRNMHECQVKIVATFKNLLRHSTNKKTIEIVATIHIFVATQNKAKGNELCRDLIYLLSRQKLKATGRKMSQQLNILNQKLKECHDISQLCHDIICEECWKSLL